MKKYKFVVPIILILLMFVSCFSMVSNAVNERSEFNQYLEKAHKAAERKISIDVDEAYSKALDINSDIDTYVEWGTYYVNIEDYDTAVNLGEAMLDKFPKNSKAFLFLLQCYIKNKNYESFFEEYNHAVSVNAANEEINALYNENKYAYELDYGSYSETYDFSNGIARVKNVDSDYQELFGYVSSGGTLDTQYINAGDFNYNEESISPVVDQNNDAYYIDTEGNRKYVIMPENITVKSLGMYMSGVLSVYDGKEYWLCDIDSKIIGGPYKYLSTFNSDIGVIQDDDGWKIINSEGNIICSTVYDGFILNDSEIAYMNGCLFAQIDDKYYLINEKGEKINNVAYDDAGLFYDSYAPVKLNGKWGFIDNEGNLIIDYQYESAKCFVNALAPVCINGKWGYITYNTDSKKEEIAIEFAFDDANSFSQTNKCAFVKINDSWKLLKLYCEN